MELSKLLRRSVKRYNALPDIERQRMDWDQRVSFVYGNLALDNTIVVTKEMVIKEVTKIYGPRP